jgi:Cd2+/Zn2+-exporting ATPase
VKKYLFRLGTAVVLSVVFSIIPAGDQVKLAAFLLAYVLVGYEILYIAVRNILKGELFDENFLMGIASLGDCCHVLRYDALLHKRKLIGMVVQQT